MTIKELAKNLKNEIETKKEYKKLNKLFKHKRTEPHEFKIRNILLYLLVLIMPKTERMKYLNENVFNILKIGQTRKVYTAISYMGNASITTYVEFKKVYPYFSADHGLIIGHAVYKNRTHEINIFGQSDGNVHFHIL